MAGFLDFLKSAGGGIKDTLLGTPELQAKSNDIVDPELGVLKRPPTLEANPNGNTQGGLLSNILNTGDDGVTFADKLYAVGGLMRGQDDPLSEINAKRTEFKTNEKTRLAEEKQKAARAKQSAALRASYIDGKFNPQAYIEAMAGDVTADELGGFTKLAPKAGVDGGYAYQTDPFTGETVFGDQRPMSYNEQIAQDRLDEQERRNQVLEQIAMGNLGVRQGQLGLSQQREGRIASGAGGSNRGGSPVRVSSPSQLASLPSGSLYIAPDGTTRRKR